MSRTGKAVLYVLSGGAMSVAFAFAGADQAEAAPPPPNDKAAQQAKARLNRANPAPPKPKASPAHGVEEKKRATQQAGRARAATPAAKQDKAKRDQARARIDKANPPSKPAPKKPAPKDVAPKKPAPKKPAKPSAPKNIKAQKAPARSAPKPAAKAPPVKPKASPAHGVEEKKRATQQAGRARAATPAAKQDKAKRDQARARLERANPEPPEPAPKKAGKPNAPKNIKAQKAPPKPAAKAPPAKPKVSPAHGVEEKKRAFQQAGRARAATPEAKQYNANKAKQDAAKRAQARARIDKANPEPPKATSTPVKRVPRQNLGSVPPAVPKRPSTAPARPAASPAHGVEEKKRAFQQAGRARAATPEAKQYNAKRDQARARIERANPEPGAAQRARDQRNARVRVAAGEGQAEREALTGRQFDARRASADVEARAAVQRRVAYAESQLGGAPGAGTARAGSALRAKIAQGRVDYHDALAGRPVGERVGKVVEGVAPGVSRITDVKTGGVSLDNFRLGPNAPSQDRLIPALSAAAVESREQCDHGDGCDTKPNVLTFLTARALADVCRDTDCRDEFAEEVVATIATGGVQPPAGENPRDVLWTLAAAEAATRGTANMKGPPKPLSVRKDAPRPVPEPAAPRAVAPPAAAANSAAGPKSLGAAQAPRYEANPKHGSTQRGNISPEPTNGQASLSASVRVKPTSPRRVGVDPRTGEYVVFDQHREGLFHGHVRPWSELTPQMQNALKKAGMVNGRGKIVVGGN